MPPNPNNDDPLNGDPNPFSYLFDYSSYTDTYGVYAQQPQHQGRQDEPLPLNQNYGPFQFRQHPPSQPLPFASGDYFNNGLGPSVPHPISLANDPSYQFQQQYPPNAFDTGPAQGREQDSVSPYELPPPPAAPLNTSLPRLDTSERTIQPAAPSYYSSFAGEDGAMATPAPADTAQQPLTRNWVLPPKPKPGRKPALDTPPTKRKAQNRAAQRAFRERRAARVHELEAEAKEKAAENEAQREEMNEVHKKELDKIRRALHASQKDSEKRAKEVIELRKEMEEMKRHQDPSRHSSIEYPFLSRFSQSSGSISTSYRSSQGSIDALSPTSRRGPSLPDPGFGSRSSFLALCKDCGTKGAQCDCIEKRLNSLPLPNQSNGSVSQPENEIKRESNDEMEIDFTSQFARPNGTSQQHPIDVDREETSMASPSGQGDYCGFCTDDTNCVCKANMGDSLMGALDMTVDTEPSQSFRSTRPQPMEPSSGPTGPGTCDDCLQNPAKAAFCRTLASMPTSRNNSTMSPRSALDASSPRNTQGDSISCSETYDQLMQNPDFARNQNRDGYLRQLRPRQSPDVGPRSPSTGPVGGGRPSAYEVEMASVLTAMNKPQGNEDGDRPSSGSSSSS